MAPDRRLPIPLVAVWVVFTTIMMTSVFLAENLVGVLIAVVPNTLLVVSGSIIVRRTEERSIGWILVILGLIFGFVIGTMVPLFDEHAWVRFAIAASAGSFALLILLVLVFPNGTPPTRFGKPAAWLTAAYFVVATAAGIKQVMDNPDISLRDIGETAASPVGSALALLAVGLQISVWRKRSETERRQIKWLLMAALANSVIYPTASATGASASVQGLLGIDAIATSLWSLAILIAITRYRLYEIDRIVSRSVSYLLVVGLLGLIFAVGVVWIPNALALGDSPLLVAASTLAVAGLFNPLRKRVHNWVDRRFNRARYDAQRVVDGFAEGLQQEAGETDLTIGLTRVVEQTLQPKTVGIWIADD